MDENKVPQLIEEVQRRPAIWNKSLNENRHKGFVGTEWDKVAANIRVSKIQAQNKWKALVKKFKGEHSRVQLHRSGDGLEDSYESNWLYYQSLLFLAGSVLPNPSTGNLDSVVDVKPSVTSIEIEDSDYKKVGQAMNQKQSDIAEEILRMQSEKYALLEKSLTSNALLSSSAEQDKHNMAFFQTLLPTLREVSKEDILLCRNDVSRVIFNYAYKNASWKSINDCPVKEGPAAPRTPASTKRKRLIVDEDDGKNSDIVTSVTNGHCQIVSSYPARPYFQPSKPIKMEKKYKPTAREREIEHRNSEMMRLGYDPYAYSPRPAWKWNDHIYEQQVPPYAGQRQLHTAGNQEWYNQGGIPGSIPASISHPPAVVNPESITRQIPPAHAFSTVGPDSVPRQMAASYVNPSTVLNSEYSPRQIPPNLAFNQGIHSTLTSPATMTQTIPTMNQPTAVMTEPTATMTQSAATMTQPTRMMTPGEFNENKENQNLNSQIHGAPATNDKAAADIQLLDPHH